jgi:DNA-binding NtrC family response regulator
MPAARGEAILVADDEPGIRESLAEVLRDAGYRVATAADGDAALAALEQQDFAVVVTDLRMPGADGLAVLRRAREISPQTVVLVMTAHASVESAVAALRAGAADYLLKPVLFDDLLAKVERCCEHRQLAWQAQVLRREVERGYDFEQLVGKGPAMQEVFTLIRKVAPTQTTVLITGESGTGKEVVARNPPLQRGREPHLSPGQLRGDPREPAREPALRPRPRRVHRRRGNPGGAVQQGPRRDHLPRRDR